MTIEFTKMHGLGNDYVYVDAECFPINDPAELSRKMSDRHLGIGGDGLILILPGDDTEFRMRMFNADGSEGETCGNAIRCFAKYVYERGLIDQNTFVIDTLAGPNKVALSIDDGKVVSVRSNMGAPRFERADIPMTGGPGHVIEEDLDVAGEVVQVTCVNIGNPHAVLFVDDATEAPVTELGPLIERHELFPQRTNVEFTHVRDRENMVMRVWERGSGVTMACGSGACAAALAGMVTGRVERRVNVHLVYGPLAIEWHEDGCVYQEGPAEEVFTGVWPS